MHLRAEDFVDLADGTRPESSAPHLASCDACHAQLAELRAMMTAAAEADVPEPSPLFWDHLSKRVHEAVEAGARRRPSRSILAWLKPSRHVPGEWMWVRLPIDPLAGAALAVIVVMTIAKTFAPGPQPPPQSGTFTASPPPPSIDPNNTIESVENGRDDVWLTFVGDLAAAVDADAVRDQGLDAMNADEAVMHLNDVELRELERLLQTQIRNQGD